MPTNTSLQVCFFHLQMRPLSFMWVGSFVQFCMGVKIMADSKYLIILFFLPMMLFTRACSGSLWVFACLVCVLIWGKPVKKEVVLVIHITKAGAAKTLGFLQECSVEGSRAKDASWDMSWRSSRFLVRCLLGGNQPNHFLGWKHSMKRMSYENSKSNTIY